jgi:hypothetical protein
MHWEQGIKFLLETGKIAHIMKEIFQKKRWKTLVTFRKISHYRLEFHCINSALDKITLPSSKLFHLMFKIV